MTKTYEALYVPDAGIDLDVIQDEPAWEKTTIQFRIKTCRNCRTTGVLGLTASTAPPYAMQATRGPGSMVRVGAPRGSVPGIAHRRKRYTW